MIQYPGIFLIVNLHVLHRLALFGRLWARDCRAHSHFQAYWPLHGVKGSLRQAAKSAARP